MRSESFIDFLERYGRANPPGMLRGEGEDFGAWQARFRAKLHELLGPVPPRAEPAVEIAESAEAEDHTRHTLRIAVNAFSTLVAYLLIPKGMAPGERRPGLIVSHGHAAYGIDSMCGRRGADEGDGARRTYALFAVRAGYVVLAPAWWGWHGRDGHVDKVKQRDKCNVIQMAAGMYGVNVIALHIQDGQAALDALAARPEVDPGRLGCLGNSYGGRTTMWLTIFDPRIRACVPAGCMNVFRERSLKLGSCGVQYPFGLLRYGDVPELFSLIAPRPMQIQAGRQDGLITPTDRDHIETTVRKAYRALGAEAKLDYVLHPEGHILLWDRAAPFLAAHLQAQAGDEKGT
ncbi:MAG: dienelactone hydrolase family protein [Kiritimatiellae bacterium]|nr:dienelactone hydrolase family protein [Kiritimatiellia bacterium]